MEEEIFKSLGVTKQIKYIQNLEEINRQKQALIESLEKENQKLNYKLKPYLKPLKKDGRGF